jgi:flavorubredoxin
MREPRRVSDDTYVVQTDMPAPPFGVLPVNWYLIEAQEPVLVDTGMPVEREQFLKTLRSLIDPTEIRWVFLTHDDNDHAGNLAQVLELAPQARVVTCFLGLARMSDSHEFDLARLHLVNPGQTFSAGDRELQVLRPPLWDSPATHCLHDPATSTLFSADSLGALLPAPAAAMEEVPEDAFRQGFQLFASALSPWLHLTDQGRFERHLEAIRALHPEVVLSTHGPVVRGRTEALLEMLCAVPAMEPFLGPDQAEMLDILSSMREMQQAA